MTRQLPLPLPPTEAEIAADALDEIERLIATLDRTIRQLSAERKAARDEFARLTRLLNGEVPLPFDQ